jgi:drug/metabolite transporter (DMT)-like permease
MKEETAGASPKACLQKPAVVCLLALLCCALWGSAFPCIKIGYQWLHIEGAGSQILFGGYRFFGAGILTFLIGSLLEKRPLRLQPRSIPFVMGQGLLQTTLQYVCFYIGLAHTTGAKGSVINTSSTFFAIFIAHFLLKNEKITVQKLVGCLVGFAGIIVINLDQGLFTGSFQLFGEGMVLLSSIAYGASSVTLKLFSHRERPITITAYQFLFGGGVMTLIGLLCGGQISGFTVPSALLLLYLSLLSTVAFSIWAMLLKHHPVGNLYLLQPDCPSAGQLRNCNCKPPSEKRHPSINDFLKKKTPHGTNSSAVFFLGGLVGAQPLQCTANISLHQNADPFHQIGWVLCHLVADPRKQNANKSVHIKVSNQLLISLRNLHILSRFLHDIHHELLCHPA